MATARLAHIGAALLILVALAHGLLVAHASDWPDGPDTFRDIGAAEMIRETAAASLHRGAPLPDLYYRGEVFWYSPLMPSLLAASSAIVHLPIHLVAARAPVFWNLGGPVAFYLCAAAFFDPVVALVALGLFLFVEPFPAREAGTYTSELIASSFAQGFFYLGLLAWMHFRRTAKLWPAVAVGCVLGVSFLAHTAVTAMLAAIFVVETLLWLADARVAPGRSKVAALSALAAAVGVLVASPGMIPLLHYHFQIRELEPFVFLDPQMGPRHALEFLRINFGADWIFTGAAAAGLVVLVAGRPTDGRRLTLVWSIVAAVLFVWAAWVVRLATWGWVAKLAMVPAHHFLIYLRAAESLLGGIGIAALVRLIARRTTLAIELPLAACVTAGLIGVNFSRYHERDALGQPQFSAAQRGAVEWILSRSDPSSVFLAPWNTGVSMIGLVRRKVVVVEPVFSNPYVEWQPRFDAWQAMWKSLEAGNCAVFVERADAFDVTHVLLVDGMTPAIPDGMCGFRKVFDAPPFAILSRVPDAPAAAAATPFF